MPLSPLRWLGAALLLSSCAAPTPPAAPAPVSVSLPDIDTGASLRHMQKLASDEFGGRLPGSAGEELTVRYLIEQFEQAGLSPGNPDGSWIQKVPLVGITPSGMAPLVLEGARGKLAFEHPREIVAFSPRLTDSVDLAGSDVVFVGYGVQAPEYGWDDFKGLDVKGKTLVMLVNDPPVPAKDGSGLDPAVFGGSAMTYYGRWTYKYEKASELGAAAVFVVHETEPAGYPYSVVQGFAGERFDFITADKNLGRCAIQGWLSLETAKRLFETAGLDYEKQKQVASTREFSPVPLAMKAAMSFKQAFHPVESKNVIAKLEGSDPVKKNENVIYTAHWDHLGVGEAKDGDEIYNGAADNASGVAAMLEMARAMKQAAPAPARSVLFLAVTAEEQGLLGSEYYSRYPLYPLKLTIANINLDDNLPMWGKTEDVIVIGLGASDLEDELERAAAEQGRHIAPDAEPEKGFYYRSDHFSFARVGVPALAVGDGIHFIGKPPGFGMQKRAEYLANDYHSPSDEVKPDWDLSGFADQAKLLLTVGYRVAQAPGHPAWKPASEFHKLRP
jgi:Zn-dependent M28 family amino/carboxypeptidase